VRLDCDSGALAAALGVVARALPARTALPVLGTVLLEAANDRLAMTGTNLELGLRLEIEADVAAEGAVAVPGRLLADFVAALQGERLHAELLLPGQRLLLECESFRTEVNGMEADEFPPGPSAEGGLRLALPASRLVEAISDTLAVASTDEARPVLTGLRLQIAGDRLVVSASDGYRLAVRSVPLGSPAPEVGLTVPARAMGEVARLFRQLDGDVELIVSPQANQVFFRGPSPRSTDCSGAPGHQRPHRRISAAAEITSRVIDGSFPDLEQRVPRTWTTTATVDAGELNRRLRALAPFARDGANVVRLEVTRRSLVLTAATTEVGAARTELDADVAGPETSLAFNSRFLLDCPATSAPKVELHLQGPLGPAVVKRPERDDYVYLFMPVRYAV
jgi:DNA polymerase-3 subunit beta